MIEPELLLCDVINSAYWWRKISDGFYHYHRGAEYRIVVIRDSKLDVEVISDSYDMVCYVSSGYAIIKPPQLMEYLFEHHPDVVEYFLFHPEILSD